MHVVRDGISQLVVLSALRACTEVHVFFCLFLFPSGCSFSVFLLDFGDFSYFGVAGLPDS